MSLPASLACLACLPSAVRSHCETEKERSLGDLLSLGRRRLPRGGGRSLHATHLGLVFFEEHGAARLTHFLLPLDTRTHFFREIQGGAHLSLAARRGLAQLLH